MVTVWLNLGLVMAIAGDWVGAEGEYRRALDLAERLGSITDQASLKLALGGLHSNLGDDDLALAHLSDCLDLARKYDLSEHLIAAKCSLADLRIRISDWDAAEPILREAEQLALKLDARHQLQEIYRLWAQLWLSTGEERTALDAAERSVRSRVSWDDA